MTDYDVVAIVPLSEEFETLREVFPITGTYNRDGITFYELATSGDVSVAGVVLNQMGNPGAAQRTERILQTLRPDGPKLVTLVGKGGGLDDDFSFGDVVIADQVTDYETRAKIADPGDSATEDRETEEEDESTDRAEADQSSGDASDGQEADADSRPGVPFLDWEPGSITRDVADEVTNAASHLRNGIPSAYRDWQTTVNEYRRETADDHEDDIREERNEDDEKTYDLDRDPKARIGAAASGGFVVTSESFRAELTSLNRKFKTVEMEAAGVMESIARTDGVNALIIRGISDFANKHKNNHKQLRSQWAVYAAASYLETFLDAGLLDMASPEPSGAGRESITSEAPVSLDELKTASIRVTNTGGPETNYMRTHPLSSRTSVLSGRRDPDGLTLSVEFEIESDRQLVLVAAGVELDTELDVEVVDRRITVGQRRLRPEPGAPNRVSGGHILSAGEPTEVRLEWCYRSEEARSGRPNLDDAHPVEIWLGFQGRAGEMPVYTIQGSITPDRGFVRSSTRVRRRG